MIFKQQVIQSIARIGKSTLIGIDADSINFMFSGLEKWTNRVYLICLITLMMLLKLPRLIGYVKSSQDDYQRVYYGDLLWRTLVIPTINYASSVRVPGSAIDS